MAGGGAMGFEFSTDDRSVRAALRRIAAEQAAAALSAADGPGPLGPRVHAMRKSVKKLRGLIRLVRPHFPAFADENAALRDAARHLGPLREHDVQARVLALLGQQVAGAPPPPPPPPAAEAAAAVAAFAAAMGAIAARVPAWTLTAKGFDAIEGGLGLTWRQARRGLVRAAADPSGEVLHEWRKRVKDHWYQARLLAPLWPEVMAPHIAAADRLGEALGDHHDLALLCTALAGQDDPAIAPLLTAARARQGALVAEAMALGARLLADRPSALVARWRGWWGLWRPPGAAPNRA